MKDLDWYAHETHSGFDWLAFLAFPLIFGGALFPIVGILCVEWYHGTLPSPEYMPYLLGCYFGIVGLCLSVGYAAGRAGPVSITEEDVSDLPTYGQKKKVLKP